MSYRNIERAICDGYRLIVKRDNLSPRFHALVTLGDIESTHSHIGITAESAIRDLDAYLAFARPDSANNGTSAHE